MPGAPRSADCASPPAPDPAGVHGRPSALPATPRAGLGSRVSRPDGLTGPQRAHAPVPDSCRFRAAASRLQDLHGVARDDGHGRGAASRHRPRAVISVYGASPLFAASVGGASAGFVDRRFGVPAVVNGSVTGVAGAVMVREENAACLRIERTGDLQRTEPGPIPAIAVRHQTTHVIIGLHPHTLRHCGVFRICIMMEAPDNPSHQRRLPSVARSRRVQGGVYGAWH